MSLLTTLSPFPSEGSPSFPSHPAPDTRPTPVSFSLPRDLPPSPLSMSRGPISCLSFPGPNFDYSLGCSPLPSHDPPPFFLFINSLVLPILYTHLEKKFFFPIYSYKLNLILSSYFPPIILVDLSFHPGSFPSLTPSLHPDPFP